MAALRGGDTEGSLTGQGEQPHRQSIRTRGQCNSSSEPPSAVGAEGGRPPLCLRRHAREHGPGSEQAPRKCLLTDGARPGGFLPALQPRGAPKHIPASRSSRGLRGRVWAMCPLTRDFTSITGHTSSEHHNEQDRSVLPFRARRAGKLSPDAMCSPPLCGQRRGPDGAYGLAAPMPSGRQHSSTCSGSAWTPWLRLPWLLLEAQDF